MNKTAIKIGGMTCAMCVQTIEKSLSKLAGVMKVTVNLGAEKAYLTYDPTKLTLLDMQQAVERAGYQFVGVDGQEVEVQEEILRARELKRKRVRFITGFAVGFPLMVLMYLPIQLPSYFPDIVFLVTTPVFLFVSLPIFAAAYRSLRHRTLNMDVMYSMGIGVALVSSIMGTFEIVLSRDFLFYEAALMLASFLTFGRYLEMRAKSRTSTAIRKLIALRPKQATVVRGADLVDVPMADVVVGDIVFVKPGEKIPVDGDVIEGLSHVDESMISGEPMPILKKPGDSIVGGTINKNGALKFRTTKIGRDTVLSQIIQLVEEAQGSKPPVQRIADRVVSYFIPVVLAIAILSFVVWHFLAGQTLLFSLTRLISILVIACPCALGLATPTAITVGIGRGAELGILIRNGEVLETAQKITTVVLDKTGTLTGGKPEVVAVHSYNGSEDTLLTWTASVEKNSQHPLADAITQEASKRGLALLRASSFTTFEGKGVSAQIKDSTVLIGSSTLLHERNIEIPRQAAMHIREAEEQACTVVLVARDSTLIGLISISDPIKESTPYAIQALRSMNLKVVMITGDNQRTAAAIGRKSGIEHIRAGVLPHEKAHEVKALQKQGEVVAFIGDGINDAPAMAQADVGIAIGGGTDIAIESGEFVLMKDDIRDAVGAIQLSKKVMRRIRQNLFWAFAYNTALIPVAAGALYPLFRLSFRPEFAGLAMAMSSVTVIALSLLLKNYQPAVYRHRR